MFTQESPEPKEIKILRCKKCGKEYIYDWASDICPECKGALKEGTNIIV